jgi:eukaryotic-like serine/threonine-protein kinase
MPLRDGDPSRIGRYRLTARLGSGGMGIVYLGAAREGSLVAVKVLRPELADDPQFVARFRREVSSLTRVQGMCTVRVIEADTDAPRPFLVTEYADGPSLAEHVSATGPLQPQMLYGLATGLAEALSAIHAAGVVHRDLKPANVLLTPVGPKVIDFGIAQALDSTAVTRTGMTVGSPGFMAPEQVTGRAGQPADVFAWALTVAYAASGRPPFGTGPADAILYRIIHDSPDISAVPPELRPLVEASLAKGPDDRPSARNLVAQLTSAVTQPGGTDEAPTQAVLSRTWLLPAPYLQAAGRTRRRWPLGALAAAAVVAAGVGTGTALLIGGAAQPGASAPPLRDPAAGRAGTAGTHGKASSAPPSARVQSADVSGTEVSAESYVFKQGYAPEQSYALPWNPAAPLNVIVAGYTGGASGPIKAFFFGDGKYLGTDTTGGSGGAVARRVSGSEIVIKYPIYYAGDPACCPSGTQDVRFSWAGGQLEALDPIPPSAERF